MAADTPADAVLKTSRVSASRHTGLCAGMKGFRSISGCFFAIGAGPEIGEVDGETKQERDSGMDETQTERNAKIALAEARIANILLMEMMEALQAQGQIKRSDIAGALLRMEWRASVADAEDEDLENITHHAELQRKLIKFLGIYRPP